MPYILGLLILIVGGIVFRRAFSALIGVIRSMIAFLGASFITFWGSVLLLSRIDAIIAGGSGWFEIPACLAVWIMTFSAIWAFLLPNTAATKSRARWNDDKP